MTSPFLHQRLNTKTDKQQSVTADVSLCAHLFGFSLELSQLILRQRQEVVIVFWVLLPAHGLQQPRKAW